jgi:putative ABC transport system permease protein
MFQDLKFALRMLRKSPATTLTAVLTLAVALGATTTIFSAVNAMLLRPLDFPDPQRLVVLLDVEPQVSDHGPSWPEFQDWVAQAPDLVALAAYRGDSMNLSGRGQPEVVAANTVSQHFFDVLGVQPVAGRFFRPEEHVPNAALAVVASEGFWHRALGSMAPGGTLVLNGLPFTLVGVAPASANALAGADVLVALERKLPWSDRGMHYLETVGRLKPGVSVARAQADVKIAAPRIAAAAKATHLISLVSLQESMHGSAAPLLLLLLAAVGLVLLIAAVNLANVELSRATGRLREFAVRRALGASGPRLARQLLVENAMVGLAGGLLGVLIALWGRDLILRSWPASLPSLHGAPLDWRVLGFAALVSVGTGMGIGLLPALHAARGDLQAGLKEGAGASSRGRARGVLVVAQSALAVLLLASAVLVLQSFSRMLRAGPGFHTAHALSLRVPLPASKYARAEQRRQFFADLLARIQALPGVRAAGAASRVPLGGGSSNGNYSVVGRPPLDDDHQTYAEKRVVSEGYFAAMQIPILRGRAFADRDRAREVVINEALARRSFPGEDPIGRQIAQGSSPGHDEATIVGIAADVKQRGLNRAAESEIYFPQSLLAPEEMDVIVRAEGDPAALVPAIRAQIAQLDPDQPVTKVRTLEQVIERASGPQRLAAQLLSAFALAALLLAALGIYGVVSYAVSRREREIGVRMALGAQAGDVLRMVLREGLRLTFAGVLCGILAALALARLLAGFLYGVSATDPATYLGVAGTLALVAVLASLLPARRATRVDPGISLRAE